MSVLWENNLSQWSSRILIRQERLHWLVEELQESSHIFWFGVKVNDGHVIVKLWSTAWRRNTEHIIDDGGVGREIVSVNPKVSWYAILRSAANSEISVRVVD